MNLSVIKNPDANRKVAYQIARVVYAQTRAHSLQLVEGMVSVINNINKKSGRSYSDIISDYKIFDVLKTDCPDNALLDVDACDVKFQLCLRVVTRMLKDNLPDSCMGATRFHRDGMIPIWAMSLGFVAEIDGFLFYT